MAYEKLVKLIQNERIKAGHLSRGLHSLNLRLNRENANQYSQHRDEVGEGAEELVQACRAL